ncbi:MAG TPA: WhiB family transcriptional regulator [Actinocrinis sp.]|jgi:WhiB family redox-sensing transcriptional regulator
MADFSRLPGPNADLWDWQLRGLCRGKDSSLFFHPEGERGAARSSREEAAKEICMNCPVRISCADHALKVREPYGVWGGMTEDEREEQHVRHKALLRAQAAREKAARLQQAKLKEKLLLDHAKQRAGAMVAVGAAAGPAGSADAQAAAANGTDRPRTRNAVAAAKAQQAAALNPASSGGAGVDKSHTAPKTTKKNAGPGSTKAPKADRASKPGTAASEASASKGSKRLAGARS